MAYRIRLLISVIIIMLFHPGANAQDSVRCGKWISVSAHYGFIVPLYSNAMDYLLRAHVPALEVDYLNKPSGDIPWQHAFHCPETGVTLFYAWLGNPKELGNMIGAYPFVNFHLQKSYREELYMRIGIGLGYMPVIFNRVTNHKDNVIGAHLNAMINLRLTTHFYLSKTMRLEAGLGITHCSDGNYQAPNLGINLLTVNTGLSYCVHSSKCLPPCYNDSVCRRDKVEDNIYVAAGLSEREPPGGPKYGAVTVNLTRYYQVNCKNKVGGGVDVFYNNTNIARMADDSIYLKSPLENIQFGIKASYELTVGKISLPIEAGAYLYSKYKGGGIIYNRIGLRYYANRHIIASLTLLTHFATADYIEWGMGYRF